jgi:hypothetical protein
MAVRLIGFLTLGMICSDPEISKKLALMQMSQYISFYSLQLDSEEARAIGYFVPRTASHMMPVYTRYDRSRDRVRQ